MVYFLKIFQHNLPLLLPVTLLQSSKSIMQLFLIIFNTDTVDHTLL